MSRKKEIRNKKPVIYLVVEGKNKTEKNYLLYFNRRENNFNLYFVNSEATDPESMIKKAVDIYRKNDLNEKNGDKVFCLIDLDLSKERYQVINKMLQKNIYKKINVIFSNPCFEIWLLYHFIEYPRVEKCSSDVKKQLKNYIKNYEENFNNYEIIGIYEKYITAMNRSENRNHLYSESIPLYERNPYTEVQNLIDLFNQYNKQDK